MKKPKYTTFGHSIAAVTNVVGNIILVPLIGIMGAAIMTMITFFIQMIYFMAKSKKFYDIELKWDFLWKSAGAAFVMSVCLVGIKPHLLPHGDVATLLILIPVGAVIYFVGVFTLGVFKREDVELVRTVFAKHSAD